MKILDMHIHANGDTPNPAALLSAMEEAGVWGGCVFSAPPEEQDFSGDGLRSLPFEARLQEVLTWSRGCEGRLFPVLWIHPREADVLTKVRRAAAEGVAAFKIICTDFYVYDAPCMELLREIAALGLPVIFHTGILWDGHATSQYNRPLNWEALIDIPGLRFSMGHCSWPWIDECIALYGKFLNAYRGGESAEMFFDLTPGTPEIYRRELLTKLYTVGYDVGDNVMCGFDSIASQYNSEWVGKWLSTDRRILTALGVSQENLDKLGHKNLLRFLGRGAEAAERLTPTCDGVVTWSPCTPDTERVIRKWYGRLGFSGKYDVDFEAALREIPISDAITPAEYDTACPDGARNFLSFLYMCEGLAENYRARGIPEDVLLATLSDLPIWADTWSGLRGGLYLGELSWLSRHFEMRLFRLGRLQFCMAGAEEDIPAYGIKKGDSVLEVHIPAGERLTATAARESIAQARAFFAKHFPDYAYRAMTCHSWMLDETLGQYLPPESNILAFAAMFDTLHSTPSDAILRYLFRWDTTRTGLRHLLPPSSFAKRVKEAALGGAVFYETLGLLKK